MKLSFLALFLWACKCYSLAPAIKDTIKVSPVPTGQDLGGADDGIVLSRRDALQMASVATTSALLLASPRCAVADDSSQAVTLTNLLEGLRTVPTFCIVDPNGANYMLYKKGEGYAKGYAFLTFPGALAVLGDAKRTAEKNGYSNVWEDARITTIPADIAIRLTLQPRERTSQKEEAKATSVLAVVPGADEREAAIRIDGKFKDQKKVPLFYLESFRTEDGATPLYFNPIDLLNAWNAKNGGAGTIPPRIQVLDMISMFQYVLRERAADLPIRGKVTFVPTSETMEMAREVKNKGQTPYSTSRMIV